MPSSNRFRHHRSALALAVCAVLWPLSVCASPTGNINLDAINAAGAYAQGSTGAGVRIGILDSGFDTTHIALAKTSSSSTATSILRSSAPASTPPNKVTEVT